MVGSIGQGEARYGRAWEARCAMAVGVRCVTVSLNMLSKGMFWQLWWGSACFGELHFGCVR